MKQVTNIIKFNGSKALDKSFLLHLKNIMESTNLAVRNKSETELNNLYSIVIEVSSIIQKQRFRLTYPNLASKEKAVIPFDPDTQKRIFWTLNNLGEKEYYTEEEMENMGNDKKAL